MISDNFAVSFIKNGSDILACGMHVMHRMIYSSVHLCNLPEAISDGSFLTSDVSFFLTK